MNKPLETQVEEIEKALGGLDRQIEENAAEGAAVESRTLEVKRRIEELAAEHEAARGDRQTVLAAGKDAKDISRRLKAIQEEREEREDEVAGLGARLAGIKAQGARLQADRKSTARKIPIAEYKDVARRYNVAAEILAPVVKELWRLRSALGEPPEGRAVHTPRGFVGALESVPRLFIPGSESVFEVGDPGRHFFFDSGELVITREKARALRPLRVDEDPPGPPNPMNPSDDPRQEVSS
jgi:hypothetical protein